MNACSHARAHAYAHERANAQTHTDTHKMHTRERMNRHTNEQSHARTNKLTNAQMHKRAQMHTRMGASTTKARTQARPLVPPCTCAYFPTFAQLRDECWRRSQAKRKEQLCGRRGALARTEGVQQDAALNQHHVSLHPLSSHVHPCTCGSLSSQQIPVVLWHRRC